MVICMQNRWANFENYDKERDYISLQTIWMFVNNTTYCTCVWPAVLLFHTHKLPWVNNTYQAFKWLFCHISTHVSNKDCEVLSTFLHHSTTINGTYVTVRLPHSFTSEVMHFPCHVTATHWQSLTVLAQNALTFLGYFRILHYHFAFCITILHYMPMDGLPKDSRSGIHFISKSFVAQSLISLQVAIDESNYSDLTRGSIIFRHTHEDYFYAFLFK